MIYIFRRKAKAAPPPAKNAARKSKSDSRRESCAQPSRTETCRTSDSPCGNSCRPIRPDEDMPLRKGDRFEELPANSARMKTCRPDGFLRRRRTARGPILAGSEGTGHSPVFGKDRHSLLAGPERPTSPTRLKGASPGVKTGCWYADTPSLTAAPLTKL